MAQALSFDQSGLGASVVGAITLEQVNQLALSCGFAKPGVDPAKPAAQRVDIAAFWKATGVNSLSAFRTVFAESRMAPPKPGTVAPRIIPNAKKADTVAAAVPEAPAPAANIVVPDVSEFAKLKETWESAHKWRIIPRPGGATMKPADFYTLYACVQQATVGDVVGEKPMWAETGGLDFDGRERWEAWERLKGTSSQAAKELFCQTYGAAMAREAENFRKY